MFSRSLLSVDAYFQRHRASITANRLIIVQHCLEDTAELLNILTAAGTEIFAFVSRHDSYHAALFESLKSLCIEAHHLTGVHSNDQETCLRLLDRAESLSAQDGRQIVIIDLGGHFAGSAIQSHFVDHSHILGIIEDTTSGHARYASTNDQLKVPVISVARSPLKEVEATYVGSAVLRSLEYCLGDFGFPIRGQNILVLGYGMIGEAVSYSLRSSGYQVSVFDISAVKLSRATTQGMKIGPKASLLADADIVISATGRHGITVKEFEQCKTGAIIVSAGADVDEIAVQALRKSCNRVRRLTNHIERFDLSESKAIFLLNEGLSINFIIKSVPNRVIDLVFTEILAGIVELAEQKYAPGLHEVSASRRDEVARDWLVEHKFLAV